MCELNQKNLTSRGNFITADLFVIFLYISFVGIPRIHNSDYVYMSVYNRRYDTVLYIFSFSLYS